MISQFPTNQANTIAPFIDVAQRPVGQEDAGSRASTIKPVEEAPQQERLGRRTKGDPVTAEKVDEEEAVEQEAAEAGEAKTTNRLELSEEDLQQLRQLAQRDREVRSHEQAHAAVGGSLAGAPSYEYEQGPDGRRYAVGGEVPISVGKIANDPQASLDNARQVKRAALAPAEPSSQDRQVAAKASQIELQSLRDLAELGQQERQQELQQQALSAEQKKVEDEHQLARDKAEEERDDINQSQQSYQLEQSRKSFALTKTLIELNNINQGPSTGRFINGQV